MTRRFGSQLIPQSLAPSSQKAYASGFRSRTTFRGLIGEAQHFDATDSAVERPHALLEFVASYGVSKGNHAGTIASKFAAVLHCHRVDVQMELPTPPPLIKRALKGIAQSTLPPVPRKEFVSRFHGTRCWKGSV